MTSPRRALIRAHREGLPVQFAPERFRLNDRALDFTIEEAKRIRDWPLLVDAVNHKLEEMRGFLNWWALNVRDKGGRPSKTGNGPVTSFVSEAEAKKLTGIGKMQKRRMLIRLKDPDKYRRELLRVEHIAAQLAEPDNHRAEGTGNNEWHTPARYIELARKVLGGIDLDPASTPIAQQTVKAKEFFQFVSADDNGLTKPWHGRVWLNPPYSPKEIAAFVERLCAHWAAGEITAAIMLTHNYTDSGWFQKAAALATELCFPKDRIRFEDPDGIPCSPTQGQAFFYFGKQRARFMKHFSTLGFIATPQRRAI